MATKWEPVQTGSHGYAATYMRLFDVDTDRVLGEITGLMPATFSASYEGQRVGVFRTEKSGMAAVEQVHAEKTGEAAESIPGIPAGDPFGEAVRRALDSEREQCALLAESFGDLTRWAGMVVNQQYLNGVRECASGVAREIRNLKRGEAHAKVPV